MAITLRPRVGYSLATPEESMMRFTFATLLFPLLSQPTARPNCCRGLYVPSGASYRLCWLLSSDRVDPDRLDGYGETVLSITVAWWLQAVQRYGCRPAYDGDTCLSYRRFRRETARSVIRLPVAVSKVPGGKYFCVSVHTKYLPR